MELYVVYIKMSSHLLTENNNSLTSNNFKSKTCQSIEKLSSSTLDDTKKIFEVSDFSKFINVI